MQGAIAWFARNPVASNLLMLLLMVGGALSALTTRVELFPEFSLDMVTVQVVMPGAAPEEVEESICIPIEEAVHNIEGVKRVRSSASEGSGTVTIEVLAGVDVERVLDDVKTRVDAIDTFPEDAEQPIIEDILMRQQVINVAVFGQADEATIKHLGERVRDEITGLPGISQVELAATRPYEISIEVSETDLRRLGLTFDDVAAAVRRSSLDLSGGSIKTDQGEILLRTKARAYVGSDFEAIVLRTESDGTRILLGDVAQVVDGFRDTDQHSRFNGQPAAMVQVFRVGDESALGVARTVSDYVERSAASLPEGIQLQTWQDASVDLKGRLMLMLRSGGQGLLLVFLVLALFLRFRLSFWVTLGIPISFLGALLVAPLAGVTINMLSLFAFILVLGIVVDDAIIVGESVSSERKDGRPDVDSAVRGTLRVATPVTFAVLTSIIAFVPLTAIPGTTGKFLRVIPLAIIPMLMFSWVESKLILPAHLSHESTLLTRLSRVAPFRWWVALQERFAAGLDFVIRRLYRPLLEGALSWRYLTAAVALAVMLLTAGLMGGGKVRSIFFPPIEGNIASARLTMPLGTSAEVTARAVTTLEAAALRLRDELEDEHGPIFRGYMASVGEQPYRTAKGAFEGAGEYAAPHLGEVTIELTPAEERTVTTAEITRRWRELCGPIPGAVELAFDASLMSTGEAVYVQFSGDDVGVLSEAAGELRVELAKLQGPIDITDSFRGGKQELALEVKPSAEALGITRLDLARQVRQGFYGEEAQRIQRGRDDIKVMVRYPERDRRSLHGLETMRVRTATGGEVPFSTVAAVDMRRGYASIDRTDRKRTVSVTSDVDLQIGNPREIKDKLERDVLPGILAAHPGVRYSFEGESREQAETGAAIQRYFLMALLVIFGIMAVPFRSYLQPAIVMLAIPFGLIGAILAHFFLGLDLSLLSFLGMAALTGVVVNDSLVLVDFVNRRRAEGLPVVEAARQAGLDRFRPILLTSLTTFAGLTPLLLERSVQAQFLIPMAVSLAFGVMFSTLVTLILVPSAYLILDDLRRLVLWLYGPSSAPAEPAGDTILKKATT